MVVRFLPHNDAPTPDRAPERDDLAEVIEMRSRLSPTHESERERESTADIAEVLPMVQAGHASAEPIDVAASTDWAQQSSSQSAEPDEPSASEDPVSTASEDAVRLLARRARSSGELRRELLASGHSEFDVEETVAECERSLYLDDLGLARVLTEGLRQRKRASRSQIRMKLRERLLPDWAIDEAVGELDEDEEQELLRQTAVDRARKMSGLDRQTAERRLLGFLARRGWSGERALRVAREALDNTAARGTVRFR